MQIRFREVLSILSKSSPYAVKTQNDQASSTTFDEIKNYLYIQTQIERDFYYQLKLLEPSEGKIIFLCGSSGDGKSEILTKYAQEFADVVHFHLDATHSFNPKETAIERLDQLFNSDPEKKNLAIGINTGMLGNYAEEGSNDRVKEAINCYLKNSDYSEDFIFLNFEQYPKFNLDTHRCSSNFTEQLLTRIVALDDNPLRIYYEQERAFVSNEPILCKNYDLLSISSVQQLVVEALFKARLMKDQFLTARALLDFIYYLLTGSNYLFENLFTCQDNEIVSKISDFDPALLRTQQIDQFVLSYNLNIEVPEFDAFKDSLRNIGFDLRRLRSPEGYIRLFYLLQNENIGNNFHHLFHKDFKDNLLEKYAKIWHLHQYPDQVDAKIALKNFYRDVLIAAIIKYNNRRAAYLNQEDFLLEIRGRFYITTHLDIKQDNSKIKGKISDNHASVNHFWAYLRVEDKPLKPIQININLLGLLYKIVEGYQPNKHDKNVVVLLDELIDSLHDIALKAKKLFILSDSIRYRLDDIEGDGTELQVSRSYGCI